MSTASNVTNTPPVEPPPSQDPLLSKGFDATNLQQLFDDLIKNAPPGDRDALQALLKDLDGLAKFSAQEPRSGLFGKIVNSLKENINDNVVPFLETLANNPGAFGGDMPGGQSLHATIDYIAENAPAHLKPLMKDLAGDIKSFMKSDKPGAQELANLMSYLVNRGNDISAAATPGGSMDGVNGNSPSGVGPGTIVDDGMNKTAEQAATIAKASETLEKIADMVADPSKLTAENISDLSKQAIDLVSDIAAAGGDTKQAEMIAGKLADLQPGDQAGAREIRDSLSQLLQTLIRMVVDEDGREANGGNKASGGAAAGAAGGGAAAGGAEGGGAAGAEGAGAEGMEEGAPAGEAAEGEAPAEEPPAGDVPAGGGDVAPSGSGGLSIFEVIAKALGDKMTSKLGQMKAFAEKISSLSSSGGNDTQIAGFSAQLSAASQEFSLLSNSFSTTIKALGEGTKAAVRYS